MKKLLSRILALCIAVCCLFCLIACDDTTNSGGKPEPGNPSVADTDTSDSSDSDTNTPESKTYTKEDYLKILDKIPSKGADLGGGVAKAAFASVTIEEGDLTDVTGEELAIPTTCVAIVNFFRNLCKNADYTLKTVAEDCQLNDNEHDFVGKARLYLAYDNAKTALIAEMHADDGDPTHEVYVYTEIFYDFDTDEISDYTFSAILAGGAKRYYKGSSSTFKMLSTSATSYAEFCTEIDGKLAEFSQAAWAQTLPDYTEEYVSALMEAYGMN